MSVEASQPLKVSLPVSAALAQALYNEEYASGAVTQYTFVKVNSSGQADLVTATSDLPIGVIQNRPFVISQGATQLGGKTAEIVILGITKLAAGGTVTLGGATGFIEMTSAGLGVAAGAVTGGSKTVLGQWLAAGATGTKIKALVSCAIPLPTGN
jgi:hypothetical protein